MSRRPINTLNQEILNLYRQGLSQKDIASKVGCNQSHVSRKIKVMSKKHKIRRVLVAKKRTINKNRKLVRKSIPLVSKSYIELYLSGKSVAEVARILGRKKNTVLQTLRKYKVLRKSLGRATEDEVAVWTYKFAKSCFRMRGDHPFDLLVDGRRVNVKSTNLQGPYAFTLNHKQSKSEYRDHVDDFYLVFLSISGKPIYKLESKSVNVKSVLTIPEDISRSKYPLQFLGFLEGGVISNAI